MQPGPGGAGAGAGAGAATGRGVAAKAGIAAETGEKALHLLRQQCLDQDSADDGNGNSGDDRSDGDGEADGDGDDIREGGSRGLKRKRPISVSCELCKQRKVKCDRGQPSCGWCSRNGALCEYKERKKPGLRAGYGRELEARLDKLESILRRHSEVLQMPFDAHGQPGSAHPPRADSLSSSAAIARPSSVLGSNASLASEDRGTPHNHALPPAALLARVDSLHTPQAEAALFLQRPSAGSFSTSQQPAAAAAGGGGGGGGGVGGPGTAGTGGPMDLGITPPASSTNMINTTVYALASGPGPRTGTLTGLSPSHHSQQSPLSTPAAREYYGASAPQNSGASETSPMMGMGANRSYLGSDQDLPPYDLSYALVDLYFKHINTWCPLLQRNPTIEALFGPSMTDETNKILLHAIVATTLRFSTDARLTEEKRQRYHDISKQRVILYGMENSSVKALQAMVILALDLCGSSNGPPGWNIMALITRAVVQLGLAVESTSFSVSPSYTSIYTLRAMILPEPRDFIEEESRRRLFWVIYLLDRYATIATAFEFALDDREIDRTLPCRDDLWTKNQRVETRLFRTDRTENGGVDCVGGGGGGGGVGGSSGGVGGDAAAAAGGRVGVVGGGSSINIGGFEADSGAQHNGLHGRPENLGAFSYYIEILGILTKIHNFLKLPVDISSLSDVEQWQMRYRELDQMLTGWKLGLPGEYGNMSRLFQHNYAKTVNCGWVMLHVTYHTAIIRLHSSSAYPTTRSPIFTPSYSASQRCHSAVENIATLTEFVVGGGLLPKLGPPFAFSLWVAARLLLVHGSTVEHKLSARVPYFVEALRLMARYWPVAERYCALLQRVLDEHSDSERHGDGVTPSSVRILADMRRTAFDLDLLISRQPRHIAGASGGGGSGSRGAFGGAGAGGVGGMWATLSHQNCAMGMHPGNGNGSGAGPGLGPTGGHPTSRMPSMTPARTPQPSELEYLDVFDFFNMPRLPFNMPTEMSSGGGHVGGPNSGDSSGNSNGNGNNNNNNNNNSSSSSNDAGNNKGADDSNGSSGNMAANNANSGGNENGRSNDNSNRGDNGAEGGVTAEGSRAAASSAPFTNEFNITDFMIDANQDWLFKQEANAKFLS